VLRLQLQLRVAAMASLQYKAALWRGHAEIQVLLAALARSVAGNAIVLLARRVPGFR
jgi:hypothetical protein